MEPLPKTVAELYLSKGTSEHELRLPCNFCKKELTLLEQSAFAEQNFHLLWKDGLAYGCCKLCLAASAQKELVTFFEKLVSIVDVVAVLKKNIEEIEIRCSRCLYALTASEKQSALENKESVLIVKKRFRSYCSNCRRDDWTRAYA
ncbi:E6 protein [Talpa europaea papillomavirus 1]|uniref:Protein E6 n=1 Tax=Talpa europaea papillomavirus 1 TaxID=1338506 RepID=R9RYF5_9PAPI|nr:E6 protein [Talpa europaea papillomavirus 1]AGM75106.1 E6 protein [Talpa europaea papillomavirus 1]AGM75112.1 E6 protein [Talpa europaea papillomavirus 1]